MIKKSKNKELIYLANPNFIWNKNKYFEIEYFENIQKDSYLEIKKNPFFEFIFCIKGNVEIVNHHSLNFTISSNEHNFFGHSNNHIKILASIQTTLGRIIFNPEFIKTLYNPKDFLFEKFIKTKSDHIYFLSNCNKLLQSNLTYAFQQIITCSYDEFYKEEFILNKVKEIFWQQLYQHTKEICSLECSLKKYQIEKINKAKIIIENKINEPCSLLQISKEIGLNDCTLKKGFKEIYGTTVFTYLAEVKMKKALELLQESNLNINEIADEIGYKNASNFISAFKKKFGHSPKKFVLQDAIN